MSRHKHKSKSRSRKRHQACHPHRRPLRFEPLEDRRLLAVITVNTVSDDINLNDNLTTLREAVFVANANPGPDTIQFDPAITPAATILLTHGEIKITDALTITGPGTTDDEFLGIDASGSDPTPHQKHADGARIFNIDDGNNSSAIDVHISHLALTGGDVQGDGGAILNRENLTLSDASITGCASFSGGGKGGAIETAFGRLDLNSVVLQGNSAFSGGAVYALSGSVTASRTTIVGNTAVGTGGGIRSKVNLDISNSAINNNTAGKGGGGILSDSSVTIAFTSITGNTAFAGGGVCGYGATISVSDSAIRDNKAFTNGGGIFANAGSVSLTDSSIVRNLANIGGGIYVKSAPLSIFQCTVSTNSALSDGGGIYITEPAGPTVSIPIQFSTIADNRADSDDQTGGVGGGIRVHISDPVLLALNHTVVATNERTGGIQDDIIGSLSARYCLIGDNTGALVVDNGGNQIGTAASPIDPLLYPLPIDDSGSHFIDDTNIPVQDPLEGSPLIDAGDPSANGGINGVPSFDQFGYPNIRVVDGDGLNGKRIDIGAVEFRTSFYLIIGGPFPDFNHDGVVDAADYTVWRDSLGKTGMPFEGADANGNGVVDAPDYDLWKSKFGADLHVPPFFPFPPFNLPPTSPTDDDPGVTFVVNTNSDAIDFNDGLLTLREAIFVANTIPGIDTIQFDPSVTAAGPATIQLSNGEMLISHLLNILGPGSDLLTIDASGSDPTPTENNGDGSRIFNVDGVDNTDSKTVYFSGFTLTGGDTSGDGGAIRSTAGLTLSDVACLNNHAGGGGGALWDSGGHGAINIQFSKISGNTSAAQGGGLCFAGPSYVTIYSCQITDNQAAGDGGGIELHSNAALFQGSVIARNHSQGSGGGIAVSTVDATFDSSYVWLVGCQVSDNVALAPWRWHCSRTDRSDRMGSYLAIQSCVVRSNHAVGAARRRRWTLHSITSSNFLA